MTSQKLRQCERDRFMSMIIEHRFGSEVRALEMRAKALAQSCYEEAFDAKEREKMEALPQGWLPRDSDILVSLSGAVERLHFNGRLSKVPYGVKHLTIDPEYRLFPHSRLHQMGIALDGRHPLAIEWEAISAGLRSLNEANGVVRANVAAVLAQASTTGRLLTLWPEAKPFVEQLFATVSKTPNVPMLPISQLNTALGLPIEEAAA